MPEVSVILPTYNRAKTLPRAVQSVLNQTFNDFELIIVDDGSIDNTGEIVRNFEDNRIKYVKCKENKGASATRNIGIGLSKGEYIAFQDSDDEWLPKKLEKQLEIFETALPGIGIVYTGFWRVEGDKKKYIPYNSVKKKEGNIHKELLKESFIGLPATVIRKKCFEKSGIFDENLPRLQDWDLLIRLSKYYRVIYINEPLLISYYTPESITTNRRAHIKAFEIIIEKYFEDFAKNMKILAKWYFYLGDLLCSEEEFKRGRDYHMRALKIDPLNIKFLLVTILGKKYFDKIALLYQKFKKIIK